VSGVAGLSGDFLSEPGRSRGGFSTRCGRRRIHAMARLLFLWLTPLAAALAMLTAASAADQQWVLWGSQAGTRWHTVAVFPTEAACRTKGQALVRNVATGSSREKKQTKVVDDPMPQSVGIAVIEIQRYDPPDPRRGAAAVAEGTAAYRASLERVLASTSASWRGGKS